MLTEHELRQLLTTPAAGLAAGRVMALRRRLDRDRAHAPAQRRLLDQLIADRPTTDPGPRHPEDDVRLQPRVGESSGRKPRALDENDRTWLNRLPEPNQVTYDDAVRLAELARDVAPRSSDERLVTSIWRPVRHRFDRAVAQHRLTEAKRPLPTIPAGYAETALAESVAATTSELDAEECRHRGGRLAREIDTAREQNREAAISKAHNRLAELEQADRDRALTA